MNIKLFRGIADFYNDEDLEKFIAFINTAGFLEGRGEAHFIPSDELIEMAEDFMCSDYTSVTNYLKDNFPLDKLTNLWYNVYVS